MLNGKIKCISTTKKNFTKGKIYDVENGSFTDDNGDMCAEIHGGICWGINSIEHLNDISNSKFELYEESLKEKVLEWSKKDILILENRRKEKCLLMTNGRIMLGKVRSIHMDCFYHNLKHHTEEDFDIYKIYKTKHSASLSTIFNLEGCSLLWRREEVIKLTLDEIAKKFDCNVSQLKIKK